MNAPRYPHLHLGLLAAAVLACVFPARAEPTLLTIGQGQAWVREFFPPSGEKEIDQLVWTNPPAQVDLDTLQIWNVRRPWLIREWRWIEAVPAVLIATNDHSLVWRPRRNPPLPLARERLEIRLAQPLSHSMGHSLTYRLPGLDWTAFYRVVVRGIGPESIDAVQVDLAGYLRIRNGTDRAYPDARVSLVGIDVSLQPPPKPFGLLDLNRNTALTDLWLAQPNSKVPLPSAYPLATEANVPADGQAEIQFAHVVRKPAQIAHVCDSDEIPSPTRQGGLPLRRVLLVPNTAAMDLGFPLPPGEAHLFLGAARGAPVQSGHLSHTPFPGTLQLDMGPVDTVRASRQIGEDKPLADGTREMDFSIVLANDLASPVRIQVIEKPATSTQWSLVRTSLPCTETTRSLQFELTLPPQATRTITYRLRLAAGKQT